MSIVVISLSLTLCRLCGGVRTAVRVEFSGLRSSGSVIVSRDTRERVECRRHGRRIVSVDFTSGKHNFLKLEVSGKKKRGGVFVKADDLLCTIRCDDDAEYFIPCGLPGQPLEVNSRLVEHPNLVTDKVRRMVGTERSLAVSDSDCIVGESAGR